MKKIILSIALIAATTTLFAQKSFKVGLGGAFNSTWLINKNVSDAGDELDVAISWGGDFGLNTQFYFNENVGLSLGIMKSGHNQKYTGDIDNGVGGTYTAESKLKLRYIDIPLMLRLGGNEKGAYFEFGPQFSFLGKATQEFEVDGISAPDYDAKDDYKSVTIGFVMGFGVDIKAGDSFTINTGLRLGYMGDCAKEYGSEPELSANEVGGIAYSSHFKDADSSKEFDYQATHRIFGGIFLGLVYTIPMK